MVKILHVFSFFRPDFTGEGVYYEKIRNYFVRQGLKNSVLAVKTLERTNAQTAQSPDNAVEYLGMFNKSGIQTSLCLAAWLFRHAKQFDVVHFHAFADRYFAGHIVCKILGLKTLQSCTLDDSPDNIVSSYRSIWRWLIRWLIRLPDAYITISPHLYNSALTALPNRKVHLIPQGVEVPDLSKPAVENERERRGYAPDDIVLLFVGGICKRKGVDILIRSMPELVAHSPKTHLLIVGPDLEDDYADYVRKLVVDLNLTNHVQFSGALDNLKPIYQFCNIMVFASHLEGFGNVLLEAMAYGLPVVSRRLPGVTDSFISHEKTGLLFDNDTEFKESAKRLIDDSELCDSIGKAARQAVNNEYEMSAIASRYVQLYTGTVTENDD